MTNQSLISPSSPWGTSEFIGFTHRAQIRVPDRHVDDRKAAVLERLLLV